MGGLSFALADKELVAFTTLSPAAAVAFIVMAATLLVARLDSCERRRLTTLLIVPLCIATVGFVLSATHLGTPSNALYVLARVGSSGLSNEVLATTLFLGVAGSFWLSSFYRRRPPLAVRRIWLGLGIALAVAYLGDHASVAALVSIPSWSTPFAPAMMVLPGVATGCLLGCACLVTASAEAGGRERGHLMLAALVGISAVAAIALVVALVLQHEELVQLRNAYGPLAERIGGYVPSAIGASLLYATAATLAAAALLGHRGCEYTQRDRLHLARGLVVATVLAYVATLLVRIQFYAMYMTA